MRSSFGNSGGIVREPLGGGVAIYREGATHRGNVWATFDDALKMIQDSARPGSVLFDPSLDSNLVIPAGTYDTDLVDFIGDPRFVAPTVAMASGVTLNARSAYVNNLALANNSPSTSPWTAGEDGFVMVIDNAAALYASGAAMIRLPLGAGMLTMELQRFTALVFAGVVNTVGVIKNEGAPANIYVWGAASILDDTLTGAGQTNVFNMVVGVTGQGASYISETQTGNVVFD